MSKLLENLKDVCLNQKKIISRPVNIVVDERVAEADGPSAFVGTQYSIRVELGLNGFINESNDVGLSITHMRQAARRNIAEFVFGEFRSHFMLIEQAMWNADLAEAQRLLRQMQAEMFEV